MELQPTNTHSIGDIIVYKCRGEWKTARVIKVNRASIRIEDGELSKANIFLPNFIRNTTNKGFLQLRGRRIYKFVSQSLVSEVREVVELHGNDDTMSIDGDGAESDIAEPMVVDTAAVSNITLHHPKTGHLATALRIGDYSRIFGTGTRAGSSGYTLEEIRHILSEWRDDGIDHVKLHFSDLDSRKVARFIKTTEDVEDFAPLVLGREKEGDMGRCALFHHPTQRVIFRTATKGVPMRRAFDTHNDNWKVETGLFAADRSFWHKLLYSFDWRHPSSVPY
jgi:hypothetical protein